MVIVGERQLLAKAEVRNTDKSHPKYLTIRSAIGRGKTRHCKELNVRAELVRRAPHDPSGLSHQSASIRSVALLLFREGHWEFARIDTRAGSPPVATWSFTKVKMQMKHALMTFLREQDGLTTVEYAIAGGLVGAAVVLAFVDLGTAVDNVITFITGELNNNTPAP
jgi:pilus assembly protein Flp/PilA